MKFNSLKTHQPLFAFLILIIVNVLLSSCSSQRAFHDIARAGDTIAVASGWHKSFTKDSITVEISDSLGTNTTYMPGDPAVRAVANLYPDPLSNLVVSERTGIDQSEYGNEYANWINMFVTSNDRDWWQTVVFLDLPSSLSIGEAEVSISSAMESMPVVSKVLIVDGQGAPNSFSGYPFDNLNSYMLSSLQRGDHFTINFSGQSVPYAMQLEFAHDPDMNNGGQGLAHVVNPTGDLKNITWSDDGFNLRVIVTPANLSGIASLSNCKFYVTGGISNLSLVSVEAADNVGDPLTTISVTID